MRALAATRCDLPSTQSTHFEDPGCRIGASAHDRYPVATADDARAFQLFEGRIYDRRPEPPIERLRALAAALDPDPAGAEGAMRAAAEAWEGEYVALIRLKRDGRLYLFGDRQGRLPLYAAGGSGRLLLSRDQRFVLGLGDGLEPDRLGLAQLLLFGFPIGRRTLVQGIDRLRPGEIVCADAQGIRRLPGGWEPASLEAKPGAAVTTAANVEELAARFTEACRARARVLDPALLALSGGLDSRAVAAGLKRAGAPIESYTFLDAARVASRELAGAERIAGALGFPWRRIDAPVPDGHALARMLAMKVGLNSLAMAYSVAVFEALRAQFGSRVSFWSGDGGDKMMPDHRPRLGAHDVTRYLVDHRPVWPPAMIAALTGVPEADLRASVAEVVAGYPERDPDQRFVRFGLAERGARWVVEGEDCNRHYFWTAAPFFDTPFARAALGVPDERKSGHRLYRAFLAALDPVLVRIPDANIGLPMASPGYVLSRRVREIGRRFPKLRRWMGQGVPTSVLQPAQSLVSRVLARQLERPSPVASVFSPAALGAVARAPQRWGHAALDGLLTATCAVERILTGSSALDRFGEERFG